MFKPWYAVLPPRPSYVADTKYHLPDSKTKSESMLCWLTPPLSFKKKRSLFDEVTKREYSRLLIPAPSFAAMVRFAPNVSRLK